MFLKSLHVHNYKSLRNVSFFPTPMVCLAGPNASGKSNFSDAIHFLSEVYKHGLEAAIARKGGYENIAFRKQRRSKAPIEFEVSIVASMEEVSRWFRYHRLQRGGREARVKRNYRIVFTHKFSVVAVTRAIRADYEVRNEVITLSKESPVADQKPYLTTKLISLKISPSGELIVDHQDDPDFSFLMEEIREFEKFYADAGHDGVKRTTRVFSKQELLLTSVFSRIIFGLYELTSTLSNFHIFHFSPQLSRSPGVFTPNPLLSSTGENLPALVDWIKRNHHTEWETVMAGMRDILPGLQEIEVQYLHTKTLGLEFKEEGVGRGWNADEVSDGTIQALAILVASVDPRSSLLLIEELENSIHPWIIKTMVERLRSVSKNKNIILTTHSPVLIDLLRPEEIWITSRKDGGTSIYRLTEIDPSIRESWEKGKYRLSEFLDSGLIPQAVPGGVY